ncbi:MAG TPA: thioredoxin domain-containing protein [Marmoricola sp.]|jgi:protein-disulfide isomerase|nr:thioredoxin domain-containing protein [Marmoricola sp.]
MSNKASNRSKTERAQALIRAQQRKERIRNNSIVAVVVVVIVVLLGVGVYVQASRDKTGNVAKDVPGNLTGRYSVTIGNPSAPTTIKLYEDLQCPICRAFESAAGTQVRAAIAAGKVKVDYHMVAFLDRSSTTNYSSRALNAAMVVLDTAGPDVFEKFHTLLYDNQPAEGSAGLSDQQLIDYAVQAGADRSQVSKPIEDNRYHQWVLNATNQMSLDNVTGTPTVVINGKNAGSNPQVAAQAVLAALQ